MTDGIFAPGSAAGLAPASPEQIAAIWERLESLAHSIGHDETRTQYLLVWRARYEREVIGIGQVSPDGPLPAVQSYIWSEDGNYAWPESATDSERRLIMVVQALMDWNRDHAIRKERKKDILGMAKAMGFSTKAINATLRDIEADAEGREEHEMQWALYRRVLGVKGPMSEAMMPSLVDARPRPANARVGDLRARIALAQMGAE